MPGLIPLIKKFRPELPIVYRSHIEIRSDLVHVKGSPQEEVWKYLWNNIQLADLFISRCSSEIPGLGYVDLVPKVTRSASLFPAMSPLRSWHFWAPPLTGKLNRPKLIIRLLKYTLYTQARWPQQGA